MDLGRPRVIVTLYAVFALAHAQPRPLWTYPDLSACQTDAGRLNAAEAAHGDGRVVYECIEISVAR